MKEIISFALITKVYKIDDAGQAAAARRHVLWRKLKYFRDPTARVCHQQHITPRIYITASTSEAFGGANSHHEMEDHRRSSP